MLARRGPPHESIRYEVATFFVLVTSPNQFKPGKRLQLCNMTPRVILGHRRAGISMIECGPGGSRFIVEPCLLWEGRMPRVAISRQKADADLAL